MLRPPIGVAILGFLALMAGISHLLIGLRMTGTVAFGPAELGEGLFLWGALAVVVGAIFVAVAFALWATQPWAWLFTWIMAIFGLFEAVLVAISTGSVAYGLGAALLPAVVLWYVNTAEIKAAFGIERAP